MKRTWTYLLAVIIATALALPVQAAPAKKEAAETKVSKESVAKIGVMDMKKILRDSKAAKSALDVLKKDRDDKIAILDGKMKDLQAREAEIKSPDSKLTTDERRDRAEKLAQDSRDLKRLQEDMNADYRKMDLELTQKILTDVVKVTDDYIKQKGVTAVFNSTGVIAVNPDADITDEIIKQYDAKK